MTDELRKEEDPVKIPETLPVLPLRDIVIFPFMIVPLYVSRERSIKAVDLHHAEACLRAGLLIITIPRLKERRRGEFVIPIRREEPNE